MDNCHASFNDTVPWVARISPSKKWLGFGSGLGFFQLRVFQGGVFSSVRSDYHGSFIDFAVLRGEIK